MQQGIYNYKKCSRRNTGFLTLFTVINTKIMYWILGISILIALCNAQFCPALPPDTAGTCSEDCTTNPDKTDTCPAGQKCCSNGCGHVCQTAAKCAVGDPLMDTTGTEIFCGRGPNRQDCPAASTCTIQPADIYAVCCPCPVMILGCESTCTNETDTQGCQVCYCKDPCQKYPCPDGEECLLIQCAGLQCVPQPTCKPKDICDLPRLRGPCDQVLGRYYHDKPSGLCVGFIYGGCDGNDNRFDTREQCERRCSGGATIHVGTSFQVALLCGFLITWYTKQQHGL